MNHSLNLVSARWLHGSLMALFSTAVSLLFHVEAGGVAPGFLGFAAPCAMVLVWSMATIRPRVSFLATLSSVAVAQVGFHLLFSLDAPHHHGAQTSLVPSVSMWLAHGCAAAITAVILHRLQWATALCLLLIRCLVQFIDWPVQRPVMTAPAQMHSTWCTSRVGSGRLLFHAIARRGPPVMA